MIFGGGVGNNSACESRSVALLVDNCDPDKITDEGTVNLCNTAELEG